MRRGLLWAGALACGLAAQARAAVYYVTVAGLGGEPDYEQRFTAEARDLDKVFKAGGPSSAHVYTLMGAQATAAQLRGDTGQRWRGRRRRRTTWW